MKRDSWLLKVLLVGWTERTQMGRFWRVRAGLTHPVHHQDADGPQLAFAFPSSGSWSSASVAALVTTVNPASPLEAEASALKRLCYQSPSAVPRQ